MDKYEGILKDEESKSKKLFANKKANKAFIIAGCAILAIIVAVIIFVLVA